MTRPSSFPRTPNTQTASWFLDLLSAGRLDLDPPYQRRSVWNLSYRQFFIDSIMRNYPTQSIFLDYVIDPGASTEYRVLDGKQRLTSVIMFTRDEFHTPQSLSDLGIEDTYYSDLDREWKAQLLRYVFTIEGVEGANPAELNQAFDRLNRNVARLNKQELRHAQYGGAFISRMESLSEDELWREVGLVTPARVRRMLDVEYVSELYVICLLGIQDGKNYLDKLCADFDEEIPGARDANRKFRKVRDAVQELNDRYPLASTRFSNVADFYSLWAALTQLNELDALPSPDDAATRLESFQSEIEQQKTERAREYLLAARQGSNKGPNRERRAVILESALKAN